MTDDEIDRAIREARANHYNARTPIDRAIYGGKPISDEDRAIFRAGYEAGQSDMRERAEEARDAAQRALEEERAIVDRIWDIFGRPDYKSLNGKTIYDLVAALQNDVEFMQKMLKVAKCPTCDNSGTTKYGDECEWCYYRNRTVSDR